MPNLCEEVDEDLEKHSLARTFILWGKGSLYLRIT